MKTKFTDNSIPWRLHDYYKPPINYKNTIVIGNFERIIVVSPFTVLTEDDYAIAKLVVAAPELLEALTYMVEAYEITMDAEYGYSPGQIKSPEYLNAKTVIKKATE